MTSPLLFVLCPAADLPTGLCSPEQLHGAQLRGPRSGFSLKLFSMGRRQIDDLSNLPHNGALTGGLRRDADGCQLICDAVVPHFDAQQNWLGVYEKVNISEVEDDRCYRCIDRFELNVAVNETCWFYPTHDGTFLSWQRGEGLALTPGSIIDPTPQLQEMPYDRSQLSVLWSLLADDPTLSCVGITYGGQRIEWPLHDLVPESMATWSRFNVDSQAETSLTVESRQAVGSPASLD